MRFRKTEVCSTEIWKLEHSTFVHNLSITQMRQCDSCTSALIMTNTDVSCRVHFTPSLRPLHVRAGPFVFREVPFDGHPRFSFLSSKLSYISIILRRRFFRHERNLRCMKNNNFIGGYKVGFNGIFSFPKLIRSISSNRWFWQRRELWHKMKNEVNSSLLQLMQCFQKKLSFFIYKHSWIDFDIGQKKKK